jgi:hypothetical protein
MNIEQQAAYQQLVHHLIAAFEREFWAGHHDRSRLLAAPLRVLHQALPPGADAAPLLSGVLQVLCADQGLRPERNVAPQGALTGQAPQGALTGQAPQGALTGQAPQGAPTGPEPHDAPIGATD